MSFNTGNPVPSTDPKDLSDNAENLDSAVNALVNDIWIDRLGVARDTVNGRIKKMGYEAPINYTSGISFTVSDNVKTVDESGFIYAPLPSELPFTTTNWATDESKFFVVQGITNIALQLRTYLGVKSASEAMSDLTAYDGAWVKISDRGFGLFQYKTGLTPNGYNIVSAQNGLALELQEVGVKSALAWGYDDSPTADNDTVNGLMFAAVEDGDYIDFSGKMFRVFANVPGVLSSSATPATTNAVETNEIAYLFQKKNITFSRGGLYAADRTTAAEKYYYPSTLAIRECEGVHFEAGSTFEAKGESYGDADASFTTDFNRRSEFVCVNGGHAIVIVASKAVTGSPTARFAGSVASIYFSSCDDVRLNDPFSNPASLGYAAYAADAWCGNLAHVGFDHFHHHIANPVAHKETLFRREDGTTPAGSSVYCGKGGIATEDRDIEFNSTGGFIADMYANGSAKQIGYAFGAGSGSINNNTGCSIRNCQEVAYAFWSVDSPISMSILNIDAEVGLTGLFVSEQPYGKGIVKLAGKLRVDDSRTWAGETEELSNTSIVASLKQVSELEVYLDLDAKGRVDLNNVKQGSIFSLINNVTNPSYGGVFIEGGTYETDGYLIRSAGWGGSSAGKKAGLVIKPGVQITDFSSAATDGFIQYQNETSGVFTHIYHDLQGGDLKVNGFRSLNSGYTITGGVSLQELMLFPRKMGETLYTTDALDRPKETITVEFVSTNGLSGSLSLMNYVMTDGRPVRSNSYITSDVGLIKVVSIKEITVSGPLRSELRLEGDVRNDFTAGVTYTVLAG